MQAAQLHGCIFGGNHEVGGTFLVAQEQVFGMPAGNRATQLARLLDREHRRMGDGLVGNPERVQIGEKLVRRGGHQSMFQK